MRHELNAEWVELCLSNSKVADEEMYEFAETVIEDMPPVLRSKYDTFEEAAVAFYETYKNGKGTCVAPKNESCMCAPPAMDFNRKRRVSTYITSENIEAILDRFNGYWKPAVRKALTFETKIYDESAIAKWLEEIDEMNVDHESYTDVLVKTYTGHDYKRSNTLVDLSCNVVKCNTLIEAYTVKDVIDLTAFNELKSISNEGYDFLNGAVKLILPDTIVDLDPTQLKCISSLKEIEFYDYRHTAELLYSLGSEVELKINRTNKTRRANLEEALGLIGKLPKRKEGIWDYDIHYIIDKFCDRDMDLSEAIERTRATNFCPDSVLHEDLEQAFRSFETHNNYYHRAEIIRLLIDVPDNPEQWVNYKCYSTIPLSASTEEARQKSAYSYSAMLKERGDSSSEITQCVIENMGKTKGYMPVDPNSVKPKVVGFEMEMGYVDLTDIPLGIWNRTLTGENVTIEINNKGVAKIKAKRSVKTASIADMNRPLGITVRVPCDTTEKVMYTNYSERLVRLNLKAAFDRPAYAVKDEYSKIFKRPV